jgi:hypothetical protein
VTGRQICLAVDIHRSIQIKINIHVNNVNLSIILFVTAVCSQRYGSIGRRTHMAGVFPVYYIEKNVEWKRDQELSLKGRESKQGRRMEAGEACCFIDITAECLDVNFNIFSYFFQCG